MGALGWIESGLKRGPILDACQMARKSRPELDLSQVSAGPELLEQLRELYSTCIDCPKCQRDCAFLQRHGRPGDIARRVAAGELDLNTAFACSLCGLCRAVCPVGADPAALFLAMRREAVARGEADMKPYGVMLNYERMGASRLLSFSGLPEGCDTVFFPGCTLPGTRPEATWKLYEHLRRDIPTLGIVLDCCAKPSHDLGRQAAFESMFGDLRGFLARAGVRRALTACPNCHKVWSRHGGEIEALTVYERMVEQGLPEPSGPETAGRVAVHDACAIRENASQQAAVRELLRRRGFELAAMPHEGEKTLCCGEGGSVPFVDEDLARSWSERRAVEADLALRPGDPSGDAGKGAQREGAGAAGSQDGTPSMLAASCAGCVNMLNHERPAAHVLDLVFEPARAVTGKASVAGAPFTYLNRIRLKRRLAALPNAWAVTRTRGLPDVERGWLGLLGRLLG